MRKSIPSPEELKKLPRDGGPEFNRLVFEQSPYLLQHAHNPVDWYPWGQEAFQKARDEDKPIFLSIGYSTCHWCHVMERESFENPEVAELMNATFVNIKVDREERPDIDNIYMSVCQAMTGGGWPLTIVMTPDKKPFFAGTYFPKEGRFGRPGMLDLVPRIRQSWKTRREELLDSAEKITAHVRSMSVGAAGAELGLDTLQAAYEQLAARFDAQHGGFGSAPKFPSPHNLTLLLRYWKRTGEERALNMVEKTLQGMRAGGMYDHLGFGFHRYSTDAEWLVPHFEKMLYDQALLVIAYVEAYQATGKEEYARTAREILTYVLRDMTAPEGGFYSAEDADSEGVEGKFYLWTRAEVLDVLGESDGDVFCRAFNIEPGGNFSNPHCPPQRNIPHHARPLADLARELDLSEEELRDRLETARQRLFEARERRIHPIKDDKILTDWNGLMIAALAKAARALDEPQYAVAAQRAADFVLTNLRDKHGRLLKRYRQGEAGLPAHLDDYAFMVWGLLDLYEANFEVRNLEAALGLTRAMLTHFWDESAGGLYFTAADGEDLLVRTKAVYDGAIPSGNSVAMLNLLRLGRITADAELEAKASAIGQAFSAQVSRMTSAHTQLLCALDFGVGPSFEVVIAGQPDAEDTKRMLRALRG
ncbi:MAG: thioredoxin domain-containing protein, partial [Planctomycetota bacterium]